MFASQTWRLAREFWSMPRVQINLQCAETAGNDPFFERIVRQHYHQAVSRGVRRLFLPRMVYGVAACPLPPTFDAYYMAIEASARRNHKKAVREGCEFRPIAFNDHLEDIAEIRASATYRQGRKMPDEYLSGVAQRIDDPPSENPLHGYPFVGVLLKGKLIGYASCLIAGEYAGIENIFGHADYHSYRVVPQLIIGLAEMLYAKHRAVKQYCYGTYFGAGESMRRFKRKFGFLPHRVEWVLGKESYKVNPLMECEQVSP
jgi:hypothetical protein